MHPRRKGQLRLREPAGYIDIEKSVDIRWLLRRGSICQCHPLISYLRALYPCSQVANLLQTSWCVLRAVRIIMRAEVEQQVTEIQQSLELLRRRL